MVSIRVSNSIPFCNISHVLRLGFMVRVSSSFTFLIILPVTFRAKIIRLRLGLGLGLGSITIRLLSYYG